MEKEKFYLTTPIYYPSGKFHIGTAYTTTLADCIKRYKELRGFDVFMLTGLDEHGQKIQTVAESRGKTPQEHVDEMALDAKKLWKLMDIKYDKFIRTTDKEHIQAVNNIVKKFIENGDIYKGKYTGWYCMPCETFFTESQLIDNKCPECGREVKLTEEESYFFNMKKYQKKLEDFYKENPNFIVPEYRKNEIFNNFIKSGLEDLCISRTTFDWGIRMQNDPKHILYVWVDALSNYISALGYSLEDDKLFKKYWPADLHITAKDIIRFHGIYWPIFLMALGLELPKKLYVHGYIVMKDGKMSKSKGNVIYPETLINKYGLDALKYYLLREMTFGNDSIFTPEAFVERFNFDLCNDLGNLLNRTIGMVNKYFEGIIPTNIQEKVEFDEGLEKFVENQIKLIEKDMDSYHISDAIIKIWEIISKTNKYIDETAPWSLLKNNENEKLKSVIYHLIENLRKIAILLKPIIPETSNKIIEQLNLNIEKLLTWESLYDYYLIPDNIKVIEKGDPLFVRLDVEEEVKYIKEVMKG